MITTSSSLSKLYNKFLHFFLLSVILFKTTVNDSTLPELTKFVNDISRFCFFTPVFYTVKQLLVNNTRKGVVLKAKRMSRVAGHF